ncbi:uncharacterized protein [Nicotiana tomentosiformis]|uniref:uncharacterized protein n=1 Tax=Nicotiana tomentosiformis TaxID=4098 RepID=UPI00388CBCFA
MGANLGCPHPLVDGALPRSLAIGGATPPLPDSFIKAHAWAKKGQARKLDIFRITQGESELLREFVIRFQKERMLLPAVPDKWADEAFTKGLNPKSSDAAQKLKESLLKFQETTWEDVHNLYESKIRIEDDQLEFPISTKGRDRDKSQEKFKGDFAADHVVELISAVRNIKEARFPKPIRYDPNKRDLNLWCKYHGNHGHRTGDCRLREEVTTLFKNGNFREFLSDRAKNNYGRSWDNAEPSKIGEDPPRLTINMIFGGNEINGVTFLASKKTKVSVTHSKRLQEVAEDDITFTEADTDGLLLPHNDALEAQTISFNGECLNKQINQKYHSDNKTPRRVQLGKFDNPRRDPTAHEYRRDYEDHLI